MWEPISLVELNDLIFKGESFLGNDKLILWRKIKITPEKWKEEKYGYEGGGFWAVALYDNIVVWYNDIEEGFNISLYAEYGIIDEYAAEQDELQWTISKLYSTNKI